MIIHCIPLVGRAFLIQSVRWRTKSKKKSPSGTLITASKRHFNKQILLIITTKNFFQLFADINLLKQIYPSYQQDILSCCSILNYVTMHLTLGRDL